MRRTALARRAVSLAVIVVLAAGCSDSAGGGPFGLMSGAASGSGAAPSSSTAQHFPPETNGSTGASPPAPSTSSSDAASTYSCPQVDYQLAHLRFDCIADGLTFSTTQPIWPLRGSKEVEPSTHWSFEEGADDYGDLSPSQTLADIPRGARSRMINLGEYGLKPTVTTVADRATTVAGQSAHLLQTTITLNPTYRASIKTRVKQEKLWIVAIANGNDVVLWYTSLPDLVSNLWATVPSTIASIKITG